jgi:hypothetical protein
MENPEKLATLGTQRHKTSKTNVLHHFQQYISYIVTVLQLFIACATIQDKHLCIKRLLNKLLVT